MTIVTNQTVRVKIRRALGMIHRAKRVEMAWQPQEGRGGVVRVTKKAALEAVRAMRIIGIKTIPVSDPWGDGSLVIG